MKLATLPFSPAAPTLEMVRPQEQFIARLATAAYEAALRAGLSGSFIDAQLAIWSHVRRVVECEPSASDATREDFRSPAPRRIVFVRAGGR
jgi:hypothetical protein